MDVVQEVGDSAGLPFYVLTGPECSEAFAVQAELADQLDLADLGSARELVDAGHGPLHLLVDNAGTMALPALARTPQGREMQFAVNFLGPFAPTVGLHDALARAEGVRIVTLSPNAHMFSPVIFDDLDHRFRPRDPVSAYGRSPRTSS